MDATKETTASTQVDGATANAQDVETEKKIKETINKLRPYLQRDGGDLQYIKFEDGTVYVHVIGACAGCMFISDDIKEGVEMILVEEVPGVNEVIAI